MVEEVSAQYPTVAHDYMHIDAATIYMVTDPKRFDVIVTDNLLETSSLILRRQFAVVSDWLRQQI